MARTCPRSSESARDRLPVHQRVLVLSHCCARSHGDQPPVRISARRGRRWRCSSRSDAKKRPLGVEHLSKGHMAFSNASSIRTSLSLRLSLLLGIGCSPTAMASGAITLIDQPDRSLGHLAIVEALKHVEPRGACYHAAGRSSSIEAASAWSARSETYPRDATWADRSGPRTPPCSPARGAKPPPR